MELKIVHEMHLRHKITFTYLPVRRYCGNCASLVLTFFGLATMVSVQISMQSLQLAGFYE